MNRESSFAFRNRIQNKRAEESKKNYMNHKTVAIFYHQSFVGIRMLINQLSHRASERTHILLFLHTAMDDNHFRLHQWRHQRDGTEQSLVMSSLSASFVHSRWNLLEKNVQVMSFYHFFESHTEEKEPNCMLLWALCVRLYIVPFKQRSGRQRSYRLKVSITSKMLLGYIYIIFFVSLANVCL